MFIRGTKAKKQLVHLISLFTILLFLLSSVATGFASDDLAACLKEMFETAPGDMTMDEIRLKCATKEEEGTVATSETTEESAVATRIRIDEENVLRPFTIMSHKQNYFLIAAYNSQGYNPDEFREIIGEDDLDLEDTEAQFQISIKAPLGVDIFDSGVNLFAGYTVRSFWQLYDEENSRSFRETNHEPELWANFGLDWEFLGFKVIGGDFGFSHQSNGQSRNLSRSWDRLYASLYFQRDNFVLAIKPWYRIPEDSDDDDNPDITDYLGHGELRMAYKYKDHVFSLLSRNNLESGFSRGALELGWSFPLWNFPYLKGYVQYFTGYGESLIDYNDYVNRIGAGILLTDVL